MIFTFLFLDLFLRITNKIIITKNQHQKQHVVWKWFFLNHSGHFYSIPWSPTHLFKWLVTCGKLWSSHFCFLIFFLRIKNRKIITKNQHQKQHVVWTAPFWIIVDTFAASHGKNVNRSPTYLFKWLVTCGKLWSSHFCFLIFFLRIKNRKIITKIKMVKGGKGHCACILYSLSHKHRWWGGMVIWDVDGGMGVGSGWWWGCLLFIIYRIYSLILPLTPPLNLIWKILKLPDSWSSCSTLTALFGHFYSIRGLVLLQH